MRRLATTVLAVVGTDAEACVRSFIDAGNVSVVDPGAEADRDPLARAQSAWSQTVRSHARYTMHGADPLAAVGAAWAAEFDGAERGGLEVAVADVLARWRADSVGLPDYYLVLDPDALSPAEKNWYLIEQFLDTGDVEYIFVNYELQKPLYEAAEKRGYSKKKLEKIFQYPNGKRSYKATIRHSRGHDGHMHIRFSCPKGDKSCK